MKKIFSQFSGVIALTVLCAALAGCASPEVSSSSVPDNSSASPSSPASSSAADSGFSGPITAITREAGSGTRGAFIELFGVEVKGEDGSKTDRTTLEAPTLSSTNAVMTQVASDKNAIGYISLGSLNDTVKAAKIDGAEPSVLNIKSSAYKISRPFNIATKGEPTGLTKDFIDFILSAEGQDVVEASGYIKLDGAPAFAGATPEGKIVVGGSSSVMPVMEKIKEAYAAVNPGAAIDIQQSDSTAGMQSALDGTYDIGMASRALKEEESAALKGIGIALDGIAVVVNKENPIDGLTSEAVCSIYTGEFTEWSQVG